MERQRERGGGPAHRALHLDLRERVPGLGARVDPGSHGLRTTGAPEARGAGIHAAYRWRRRDMAVPQREGRRVHRRRRRGRGARRRQRHRPERDPEQRRGCRHHRGVAVHVLPHSCHEAGDPTGSRWTPPRPGSGVSGVARARTAPRSRIRAHHDCPAPEALRPVGRPASSRRGRHSALPGMRRGSTLGSTASHSSIGAPQWRQTDVVGIGSLYVHAAPPWAGRAAPDVRPGRDRTVEPVTGPNPRSSLEARGRLKATAAAGSHGSRNAEVAHGRCPFQRSWSIHTMSREEIPFSARSAG